MRRIAEGAHILAGRALIAVLQQKLCKQYRMRRIGDDRARDMACRLAESGH